jgi:DNA processing protein
MTDQDRIWHIALAMHPQVGPVTAKTLIGYCGSIEAVFREKKKNLLKIPGIGNTFVSKFSPDSLIKDAETEFLYTQKNDIKVLIYTETQYPKRLTYFDQSPIVLYYKGDAHLNHHRTVAIVGTRKPSDYGHCMCDRIIEGLKSYDVILVSGLAYGIDSMAHRQCVALKVPTLGVMAHGHDMVYPSENKVLVRKMIEAGGGLLTEFPINTRPDRENFPMRNRIIAALSDAIVIIESKKTGGSIITAEFGNEYNKDVFALPGSVNHELSTGCNHLIKTHKAHLLECADDLAYIMRWNEMDANKPIQTQLFIDLDENEAKALQIIKDNKEISIDQLTYIMDMTPSLISGLLLGMEFKGAIRALPGKKYTSLV